MCSIFFHKENTFIGNECYIDGKAGLSAIFLRNHHCDRCTFACTVEFFIYPCHRTLLPCSAGSATLTSGIRSHSSQTVTCRSSSISCSTIAIVLAKTEGRPECCSSWTSVHELSDPLLHVFDVHTLWPIDFTILTMNVNGGGGEVVRLALKKLITTRNLHLVGEARGSSIANGCPVKA